MNKSINKKTIVLGASDNPSRYSFLALQKLKEAGHDVIGIGKRETVAGEIAIHAIEQAVEDVHTVTIYLNPGNQRQYYDYILSLHPRRIIFNPGTENNELKQLANREGITTLDACTLVLLSTGQY
ncbi:MAG: CoA-binding protein [Bacteroidetes bacterium]|nr:CoA-binding protein [Bacteroidota bacterium]